MITSTFQYHRPNTIAEAVGLLQRYGGEAKLLAGGHSLLPTMKMRLAEPLAQVDHVLGEALDVGDEADADHVLNKQEIEMLLDTQ